MSPEFDGRKLREDGRCFQTGPFGPTQIIRMLNFHPLTAERWPDLEDLFGKEKGANSGCWCMWPRVSRSAFEAMSKDERKRAFRKLVKSGPVPGLLAYENGKPIAWMSVGPRADVLRFQTTKTSKPEEDESGVYAITCFYVRTGYRRRGLMKELATAAMSFAREKGARAVDACPVEADRPLMWGDGFVGIASVFRDLGFTEIARRSPRRPLMRFVLRSR
ncbi:MAG: GNAT family N-acetyltransferase [Hyphomicrobiales bacterium]